MKVVNLILTIITILALIVFAILMWLMFNDPEIDPYDKPLDNIYINLSLYFLIPLLIFNIIITILDGIWRKFKG